MTLLKYDLFASNNEKAELTLAVLSPLAQQDRKAPAAKALAQAIAETLDASTVHDVLPVLAHHTEYEASALNLLAACSLQALTQDPNLFDDNNFAQAKQLAQTIRTRHLPPLTCFKAACSELFGRGPVLNDWREGYARQTAIGQPTMWQILVTEIVQANISSPQSGPAMVRVTDAAGWGAPHGRASAKAPCYR